MLKISYRDDEYLQGLDIHIENELLPDVIKSIINSLKSSSVVFLKIEKSHIENNRAEE